MIASACSTIPTGPGWVHEIKWDGMRVIAQVDSAQVTLHARSGRDVTSSFPELAGLAAVAPDVVLDGEVVAMHGTAPSFHRLASRMHVVQPAADLVAAVPVTYVVFDLLRLDGHSLVSLPLSERRRLLEDLDLAGPSWHLSPLFEDGPALFDATAEQGLEGIVSKRLDSRYEEGARTPSWLKMPHRPTGSYVVGGWRSESTGSPRLGAVLLGTPSTTGLAFRGRCGSGLAGAAGRALQALLVPAPTSPFDGPLPPADARGARWVEPTVVVDVAALGIGTDGRLRQPSYQRLRPDLTPAAVAAEEGEAEDAIEDGGAAAPGPVPGVQARQTSRAQRTSRVRLTSPDKVLYPATGTTKAQVAAYYEAVADRLLPELADRPVTRIRWPHGVTGPHFFEKNVPKGLPEAIARVTLPAPGSTKDREVITYPLLRTADDLVTMANLGALELHTPQWRVSGDQPLHPDRLVIDLDPAPPAGLNECAVVALIVRDRLASLGLECTPVTSGSKGLQLYAPLDGSRDAGEVRAIAKALAELLTAEHRDLVLSTMRRDLRPGKVLLDWSQNSASKTTITPWSLRGRERPSVACPRTWGEVEAGAAGEPFEQILYTDALTRT